MNKSVGSQTLDDLRLELDSSLVMEKDFPRFKLAQRLFTDEDLFQLEMKYIFERNWVYVAHESQIPNKHDYLTTFIGREPIVLTRTASGKIKCFINSCTHRGARLCRQKKGSGKFWTCGFHGWTFKNSGELVDVTDEAEGGYPESFDKSKLGLHEVLIDSYHGFIFGSLSRDVLPLSDYLGDAKTFIDLLVAQSPENRMEVLRGASRYAYHGNWKLQAENGLDGYHPPAVHGNYIATTLRRARGESSNPALAGIGDGTRPVLGSDKRSAGGGVGTGGFFSFENGHQIVWVLAGAPEVRANFGMYEWMKQTHGEERAWWVNKANRNLLLFPNVFLMDLNSTQIRIIRPISVDRTEIISYAMAPVGEKPDVRAMRIRQFEDFLNAAGLATPDDLAEFNNCQIGFGRGERYSDVARGATRWVTGSGKFGEKLQLRARLSGEAGADEGLYLELHREWTRRMRQALDNEAAAESPPARIDGVLQ